MSCGDGADGSDGVFGDVPLLIAQLNARRCQLPILARRIIAGFLEPAGYVLPAEWLTADDGEAAKRLQDALVPREGSRLVVLLL